MNARYRSGADIATVTTCGQNDVKRYDAARTLLITIQRSGLRLQPLLRLDLRNLRVRRRFLGFEKQGLNMTLSLYGKLSCAPAKSAVLVLLALVLSACGGNSESSVSLIDASYGVEQGKRVIHNLNLPSASTITVSLESKNGQPFEFFIVKDKDYSTYLAGGRVSIFLPLEGYSAVKQVNFPAGSYKAVTKHGKEKSLFGSSSPDAVIRLSMTM